MDTKRLAEIRARSRRATMGPWRVRKEPAQINELGRKEGIHGASLWQKEVETSWDHPQLKGPEVVVGTGVSPYCEPQTRLWASDDNLDFIAHAREDVPYLLDRVERLEAALAEHGGWVYFREEDPANPVDADRVPRRMPPGKYREICRACGAYRKDGHRETCAIARALAEGGDDVGS